MAEHRLTDFTATVTWMGTVPVERPNIRAQPISGARVTLAGLADDYHGGTTRASCVRVKSRHTIDTQIANTRQLSILSAEELAEIAVAMDLDTIDPALLGATLVIEGIPDFTHIPPAARLQAASGATLVVDVENGPCNLPAREIEKEAEGHGKAFKVAARGKRGVTAWVEREGALNVGDTLRLFVPDQRAWTGE